MHYGVCAGLDPCGPDGLGMWLVDQQIFGDPPGSWRFDGRDWVQAPALLHGLQVDGREVLTSFGPFDRGVRLRDLDGDGRCEFIVGSYYLFESLLVLAGRLDPLRV